MYDTIKLQRLMVLKNHNYHTLAKASGIHNMTVKHFILTGEARPRTVAAVTRALGIRTLREIMKGKTR